MVRNGAPRGTPRRGSILSCATRARPGSGRLLAAVTLAGPWRQWLPMDGRQHQCCLCALTCRASSVALTPTARKARIPRQLQRCTCLACHWARQPGSARQITPERPLTVSIRIPPHAGGRCRRRGISQHVGRLRAERGSNPLDAGEGRVPLAALQRADEVPMHPHQVSQILLAQVRLAPEATQVPPEGGGETRRSHVGTVRA